MRILIDITHPAHVHFFWHPIQLLKERGHEILITSRVKEMATDLLDALGVEHLVLCGEGRGGLVGLGVELVRRNLALARVVKRFRPHAMSAIGGIFVAQVGRLTGVRSVVFYDTENAWLQNTLTYPFASCVVVPRAYRAWVPKRHLRYPGYHELSYLHPNRFTPDHLVALENGLAAEGATFFLRLVSWRANHDVGERGWNTALLTQVVEHLRVRGKVLISAETELPAALRPLAYQGAPSEVHHLLAFCRLFVGESATMASECAVLGTPAIYAAQTGRGYTDEQEQRYGLVRNVFDLTWPKLLTAVDQTLTAPVDQWRARQEQLLADTLDVAPFVADCIEDHRQQLTNFRR